MKITLTRQEYRDLIDMLYIARWILNAHRIGEDPRLASYSQIEQKLYQYAKQVKYDNLIMYDQEDDKYFPTREYEETSLAHTFITEYDDDTFWEELISRMAERDLRFFTRRNVRRTNHRRDRFNNHNRV